MGKGLFPCLALGLLFFLQLFGGFGALGVLALPLLFKKVVYHLLALLVLLAQGRGQLVGVDAYVVGRVSGLNDNVLRGGLVVAGLLLPDGLVQKLVGFRVVGIGNQEAVQKIHRLVVLALVQVLLNQSQGVLPGRAVLCPGRRGGARDSPDSKEKEQQKQ